MHKTDLHAEAAARNIRIPQPRTLARYGLTEVGWLMLLESQGWACAVCGKADATFNTDHEHVKGWKRMPPEERVKYVRGILCWWDNRYVVQSNISAATSENITAYLKKYEARRDS